MPPKATIRWKSGKIFSLRLRNGSFALMQMLERKGQVAVFDEFRAEDDWNDVRLGGGNVLFVSRILQAVYGRSVIAEQKHILPVQGIVVPDVVIDAGSGFRDVTFWPGTPDERTVLVGGNGQNKLWYRTYQGGEYQERLEPVSNSEYDRCRQVEMSNLRDYPEFNERLYLCSQRKANFDPLREIAFDRPLDLDCRTYIDIISGKVKIGEFGY